jgi:hypothetical protein
VCSTKLLTFENASQGTENTRLFDVCAFDYTITFADHPRQPSMIALNQRQLAIPQQYLRATRHPLLTAGLI